MACRWADFAWFSRWIAYAVDARAAGGTAYQESHCTMSSSSPFLLGTAAVVITLLIGGALAVPRLRRSRLWLATVTPLASIIGSGFLIIAPLLHAVTGRWALATIAVLSVFSYAVGSALRFNIEHAESLARSGSDPLVSRLERLAQLTLGAAYAISVAFYVSLFVAFLSERIAAGHLSGQAKVTTLVLAAIGVVAWVRGTRGLETVELVAVTIKLAIIGGVLAVLGLYDVVTGIAWFEHERTTPLSTWDTLAVLGGLLMVTQGFETTRFTGAHYTPEIRIRAARNAQFIAIAIYVVFIGLTCPLFLEFPITELTETTVSRTLGQVVPVLPLLLFVAATASQLSAALADTIGGGGLLVEVLPVRLGERAMYVLLTLVAVAIVWSTDVFGIINLASKGFALFYLLQVLIAARLVIVHVPMSRRRRLLAVGGCTGLALALVFVVLFSRPAPHA